MKGEEIMSDPEYDSLVEQLVDIEGEQARPYSRTKQSDNINDIVGTITKVYGITAPFVKDKKYYVHDFVQKHNLTRDMLIALQYKLDGCSVAFDYETERFFTRGDYANGESSDVTELFEQALPQMYELNKRYNNELKSAKFEFICSRDTYNLYFKEDYKRPRDAAAAHLKVVSDPEKMANNIKVCNELMDLIPLRVISKSNHTYICEDVIADIIPCTDYTRIEEFIDRLG
jgi:NAD-dependent DNA ligase